MTFRVQETGRPDQRTEGQTLLYSSEINVSCDSHTKKGSHSTKVPLVLFWMKCISFFKRHSKTCSLSYSYLSLRGLTVEPILCCRGGGLPRGGQRRVTVYDPLQNLVSVVFRFGTRDVVISLGRPCPSRGTFVGRDGPSRGTVPFGFTLLENWDPLVPFSTWY